MKRIVFFTSLIFFAAALFADDEGVLFEFNQQKGAAVVHVATVEEEAYLNGQLHNQTQFINRTSTTVTETQKDGSAKLFTHYMTTQNNFFKSTGKCFPGEKKNL